MNENQEKILALAKKKDLSTMKFREIARDLGIKNVQTVIYHMKQLKKKGLIYVDIENKQRVAKPKAFLEDNIFNIPVVGAANCGPAMELAQENIESYLQISARFIHKNKPDGLIVVRAVGNSLNRADVDGHTIEEGDYVIVDTKAEPENGKYVLSIINGAANFKRFYKDNAHHEIRLVSESTEEYPPIVLSEEDMEASGYCVNGVVMRVVKKHKEEKVGNENGGQ